MLVNWALRCHCQGMKTILIVGIGTGNPEHLTVQAINALNRADVLFIPDKGEGKTALAAVRRDIIGRYVTNPASRTIDYAVPQRDAANPDYGSGVADWHSGLAAIFGTLMEHVPERGAGAFLVWGDPGLYDSTIRIVEQLGGDHRVEVVPGITAIQALTAAHAIGLNRVGEPVLITTGRRLGPVEQDTVVMLDSQLAFEEADPDLQIFWGAYLGTADEMIISGRIGDVRDTIMEARRAARAQHGWIMDTYLLRRPH